MELTGRTEILSLFDLVQMLSVNDATGMLRVVSGPEKGYLYFQAGTIINALDDDHFEGEEAAKRVFAMRNAEFRFTMDLPSVAHRIDCSTQNLMMEIARQLDEELENANDGSHGDRLREAQKATEELNRIFSQLDSDSKILAHRSHQGFGVADLIAAIKETPGSTLFLREDAPPEVRVGERMIPISETRLDRRSYEGIRDHLVREAGGRIDRGPGGTDLVLNLGTDGSYRVEVLEGTRPEMLTLRPTTHGPLAELPWSKETIDGMLVVPGSIVLLVGPDGAVKQRAFECLASHLVPSGPAPLLGIARLWPHGLDDGRASCALLSSSRQDDLARGPRLVDQMSPALVMLDEVDNATALAIAMRAIQRGSRAVLTIVARSPAHAPSRLLAPLETTARSALAHHLGAGLTGVLTLASGDVASVAVIDDPTRASLSSGDLRAVATALAQGARA